MGDGDGDGDGAFLVWNGEKDGDGLGASWRYEGIRWCAWGVTLERGQTRSGGDHVPKSLGLAP